MNRDNQQQTVSEGEIGWLAGIIEGEGSVVLTISRRKNRSQTLRVTPRVILTNTDQRIIEKIVSILDSIGIGKYVKHTKANNVKHGKLVNKSYKDITYVYIQGILRMRKLLNVVIPFMYGEKKIRAEILKRFLDRRIDISEKLNIQGNFRYDEEDVEIMLEFLRLTQTKNYDHTRRMLNEYTQGTVYKKRVKMYSELAGNDKRVGKLNSAI